jgi:hypothetical protein
MVESCARLSRDRKSVRCGRADANGAQTCTGELGRIETITSVRHTDDLWATSDDPVIPLDEPARILHFAPGWAEHDGTWQLTKHARDNVKHGGTPDFRRKMPGLTDDERLNYLEYLGTLSPRAYPVRAKCPRCQCVQVLDLGRLELTPPEDVPARGLTFPETFDRPRK